MEVQLQVPNLRTLIKSGRANDFRGKLVTVHMAITETMDPEYYPGAVQDQTSQWRCSKYGNDCHAMQNGVKQVAYWQRMPVAVQSIPGISEWCNDPGHTPLSAVRPSSMFGMCCGSVQ